MIIIIANFLIGLGCLMIIVSSLLILRSRDIYQIVQFICISNIYGFSILLFGVALERFSTSSFIKIIVLIIFNIIITIIVTQVITRRAMIAGVNPFGKTKKIN